MLQKFVIALSGPDGTGKTTHTELLSTELSKRGFVVRRVWIKNIHLTSYLIILILERINKRYVLRSTSGAIITSSISRYGVLWAWIESLNIVLKIVFLLFVRFFYKLIGKDLLYVADRYILDSLVHILISIIVLQQGLDRKKRTLLRLLKSYPYKILRSLATRFSVTILLDGEEEILIERKKRGNQKPDPYWYIALQRMLYRIIVKALAIDVYYVDTTRKPIIEVQREIEEVIGGFS